MRKIFAVFVMFILTGCAAFQRGCVATQADIFALQRSIVLYSANGDTIKIWSVKTTIKAEHGGCYWFLDDENNMVGACGTLLTEEKQKP